jgi:hypothetical protein
MVNVIINYFNQYAIVSWVPTGRGGDGCRRLPNLETEANIRTRGKHKESFFPRLVKSVRQKRILVDLVVRDKRIFSCLGCSSRSVQENSVLAWLV